MVKQLKVITSNRGALLGGGYITANFNTPIIVKKGSKITMDKWYADLEPSTTNFLASELQFLLNTDVGGAQEQLTELSGVVPSDYFANLTDYLATISASFNNMVTSYIASLAPTIQNGPAGRARLYKFNRGLAFTVVVTTAPVSPPAPATQALNIIFNKYQFTEVAPAIQVPYGVTQPLPTPTGTISLFSAGGLSVGQRISATTDDYLIQGGGFELAIKLSLAELQPTAIFAGLKNKDDTKTVGVEIDCSVVDPTIFLQYANLITGETISQPSGYSISNLIDPFLARPYGSFRFYQINGEFKIRYEIPATAESTPILPNSFQIGAIYEIVSVGGIENIVLWQEVSGLIGPFEDGDKFVCVATTFNAGSGATAKVPFQVFDISGEQFIGNSECTSEQWYGVTHQTLLAGALPAPGSRLSGLYIGQPLETEQLGDIVQSLAGTFSQNPRITDLNYAAVIQFNFSGTSPQLLGQLGIGVFAPLSTTASPTGLYTGQAAISFSPWSPNQELALEIVDLPLQSFVATADGRGGARTNVVAYFIPQFLNGATQPSTRLAFTQGLYQWLYLDSRTDIQLTSLSFRVYYPYNTALTGTNFRATSMSFNILVEDGDQIDY